MFKTLIKKITFYDKLYFALKDSVIYQLRKRFMGQVANMVYGSPSKNFFVIGVTGTNGKTTTVNLLHKILNEHVSKTVMVSTANIKIGNQDLENNKKMTSLDVFDLQSILATAKDSGCKIAVLEASSHGLNQYRFEGVEFDFAVLTNITHDHLDFHGTFERYTKAKEKLFRYVLENKKQDKYAAFPADDKIGKQRFEDMPFDKKLSYSINASSNLRASNIQISHTGTTFSFNYLGQSYDVKTKLVGEFNVYNILAALSVVLQMGVDINQVIKSIEGFETVTGRMEQIEKNWIRYFVDFAHTPDALEKTLDYLSKIKWTGRLITLFWAPGNRDKTKRPIMGEIAAQYSDIVIATDDDPDTENRLEIIEQLVMNIKNKQQGKDLFLIPERTLAIKFACEIAKEWDIVMFAGKGHETMQLTNFGKRKWSDKEEVLRNLMNN
ncbi:MAG: UDP-N-acetylmuramoylalanyl-D-glutamyl-2, 6-diaminopimelate ligase [uncultured bacterium (gcode 4)]|uniref:UDP-N-acetylmuramoylalanyl-D-glutamyl-2, 6-diaminopimelate ligase n=1 Tax=uncultured bacterium (gcode 4) TaxID=1234023 RepID=K1YIW2_9BACT|nr:MAG: UDP-N-acetylmuramoylalanyl-D-glutamyl-2, 6-diaminopimelate ligase [uncultured bacterium (gcode 4)]